MKRRKSCRRSGIVFPIFNTLLMLLIMLVTLYPVLNTVAISLNEGTDALRGGIKLVPRVFSLKSYQSILTDSAVYQALWISASRTVITTILNLVLTSMLAYTLSRREYLLRKPITTIFVLTMYVNAGLIPNYLLISRTLHLNRTYWVYIIPNMISCFNMIVIRTYIMGLPEGLVESARIDGANDIVILCKLIVPLVKPTLAVLVLYYPVLAYYFPAVYAGAGNGGAVCGCRQLEPVVRYASV